jgi:hypothetical protein
MIVVIVMKKEGALIYRSPQCSSVPDGKSRPECLRFFIDFIQSNNEFCESSDL